MDKTWLFSVSDQQFLAWENRGENAELHLNGRNIRVVLIRAEGRIVMVEVNLLGLPDYPREDLPNARTRV